MAKFKVGDKVKYINNGDMSLYGTCGTVVKINGKSSPITYDVEYEKGGLKRDGYEHLWTTYEDNLELVENKKIIVHKMDLSKYDVPIWGYNPMVSNSKKAKRTTVKIDTGRAFDISSLDELEEIKKERNEMKLLEIYEERKRKEIETTFVQQKEEVLKFDELRKEIKEFEKKLIKKYDMYVNIVLDTSEATAEAKKQVEELEKTARENVHSLCAWIEEVKAQLELCDTYDQKMTVLTNYNIINGDTVLNIERS